MSSKKKESKSSEKEKEKVEKKRKSSKEGDHSSEDDDSPPNRHKSASELSHGDMNLPPVVRKSGSALEKTEEQKERRVSKDDEDKEKKRKERRGKRYSMDKTFLSSASHIVISLTDKRDKEIVNVIHSDIAEEKVDPAVENAEYENYKLTPESQNQLKTTFHYFSSETCQAFGKILEIVNSREVNAQLLPPEFVLIGPTGHGKSSILEALLGQVFVPVGWGVTKRPLIVQMFYNSTAGNPKWILKRDPLNPESVSDMKVSNLKDLTSELQKRSQKFNKVPNVLQCEYNRTLPFTLIDTPGISFDDQSESQEILETVISLIRPLNRIILCIEESNDWSKLKMPKLIRQFDPEFTRTVFVFTKFHSLVTALTSTTQTNKFFQGVFPNAKIFFTELPSHKLRQQLTSEQFQEKMFQIMSRELIGLEKLQYDKKYEKTIGTPKLCQYVMKRVRQHYNNSLTQIINIFKQKKEDAEKSLNDIRKQTSDFQTSHLRTLANEYIVEFSGFIERLLTGTYEGFPSENGQTLFEEKSMIPNSVWMDLQNRPIIRNEGSEKEEIPLANVKLYGGQQFERLLSEFKFVCERLDISHFTPDDIAVAMGTTKFTTLSNEHDYAVLTAAIAQVVTHCCSEAMKPFISLLTTRTIYIMKRTAQITEKILHVELRKKKSDSMNLIINPNNFPFFVTFVREIYDKFVEEIAKECQLKCLDEFYNPKTLVWEMNEFQFKDKTKSGSLKREKLPKEPEDTKQYALKLANELFNNTVKRIMKSVILKFYNFVFIPLQSSKLLNVLQKSVGTLNDERINELFQFPFLKEKLKNEEKKIEARVNKLVELEKLLTQAISEFKL